jgi:hypothetical protein
MPSPFQVTHLRRTNDRFPTEWEGLTADGRGIYARYGGGELTVYLGHPDDGPELAEVNGRLILLKVVELDDPNAGFLTLTELKRHTGGYITWPDRESPADDD